MQKKTQRAKQRESETPRRRREKEARERERRGVPERERGREAEGRQVWRERGCMGGGQRAGRGRGEASEAEVCERRDRVRARREEKRRDKRENVGGRRDDCVNCEDERCLYLLRK